MTSMDCSSLLLIIVWLYFPNYVVHSWLQTYPAVFHSRTMVPRKHEIWNMDSLSHLCLSSICNPPHRKHKSNRLWMNNPQQDDDFTTTTTTTAAVVADSSFSVHDSSNNTNNNINNQQVELIPQIQFPPNVEQHTQSTATTTTTNTNTNTMKALVLVDIFSPFHGNYLSHQARYAYGCAIVNVLSSYLCGYLVQQQQQEEEETNTEDTQRYLQARIPLSKEEAYQWFIKLPSNLDIVGIHCESDSGLEDSEKLGVWIHSFQQQRHNINNNVNYYNTWNPARRDKFQMIQQTSTNTNNHPIRSTMKQCLCTTMEEAIHFYSSIQPCNVILKPTRGVASDGVYLCKTKEEVIAAFQNVHQSPVFGSIQKTNDAVLLQEYIGGTEYAVDVISKGGQHKIAAIWKYDKRSTNWGAPFVYYATQLISVDHEVEAEMAANYVIHHVLNALHVEWGMTHTEVKVVTEQTNNNNNNKPHCQLIEVNCRQHNTDFAPMANICIGYNALDMLLAAYLDPPTYTEEEEEDEVFSWDDIPVYPTLRFQGTIVHLVCYSSGIVNEIKHMETIQELESFVTMEIYPKFLPSSLVEKTKDIRSDAGWIHLINSDKDQLQQDYDTITSLMPTMFITSELEQ